jgi:CubicO group peptidase (beta-lactamase class C family)
MKATRCWCSATTASSSSNQNGYDGRVALPLASGTKTFSCVLAALARGDGLLTLDEPVARTLPELADDSLTRRVTIRQILNLTSGLEADATGTALTMVSHPGHASPTGGRALPCSGK